MRKLDKTLVLVGMMGAGKTSVGRRLAATLGVPFRDADVEIETAAGCTINDIFERFGEPAFRSGERKVSAGFCPITPFLAGGGRCVSSRRNRQRSKNTRVHLASRSLDLLVQRVCARTPAALAQQRQSRGAERLCATRAATTSRSCTRIHEGHDGRGRRILPPSMSERSGRAGRKHDHSVPGPWATARTHPYRGAAGSTAPARCWRTLAVGCRGAFGHTAETCSMYYPRSRESFGCGLFPVR